MTLSIMNVAVQLVMDGDKVGLARIAAGRPWLPSPYACVQVRKACWLAGSRIEALIRECAAKAVSETSPIDDQRASAWYRQQAGRAMTVKALIESNRF